MKKLFCALCLLVIFSVFVTPSYSWEGPKLPKNTVWKFSEGFTKVTINGKTYDNYIYVIRDGNRLEFVNLGTYYLYMEYFQRNETIEQYFDINWVGLVRNRLSGHARNYPNLNIVSVNYLPWQKLGVASDIAASIPSGYRSFALNPETNGYEYSHFRLGGDIEDLKLQYPLEETIVYGWELDLYESSAEAEADGLAIDNFNKERVPLFTYGKFVEEYAPANLNLVPNATEKEDEAKDDTRQEQVGLPDSVIILGDTAIAMDVLFSDDKERVVSLVNGLIVKHNLQLSNIWWRPKAGVFSNLDDSEQKNETDVLINVVNYIME